MTKRWFLALGLVALVGSSCDTAKKMGASLGELNDLHEKLKVELGEDAIGVNLMNDELLTITLVNSPKATLPPPDREKQVRSIATFAYASYPARAKLQMVRIVFSKESSFLVFHSRKTSGNYAFPAAELAAPDASSTAVPSSTE